MPVAKLDEIRKRVGEVVGTSSWIEISQADIDTFADVTGDRQFIHVDPEAAARTPFGGTIAHGFLTLSLLSRMADGAILVPDTSRMVVNYGFEKVRFVAPVKVNSKIRLRREIAAVELKNANTLHLTHKCTIEIHGED